MTPRTLLACALLAGLSVPLGAETPPPLPAGDVDGAPTTEPRSRLSFWQTLGRDYTELYTTRHMAHLGFYLAPAAGLANSDLDQELYDSYRESYPEVSSAGEAVSHLGDAAVVLPVVLGPALAMGISDAPGQGPMAAWWRRSARGYLVGGPGFFYLQQLTGGSRPGEPEGAGWRPFEGNHGISGHAFLAAVPLLTWARQARRPWVKGLAIGLSLLPAWGRVDEGQHFPSQALLGWGLAWEATAAVAGSGATHATARSWEVMPWATPEGGGLAVAIRLGGDAHERSVAP